MALKMESAPKKDYRPPAVVTQAMVPMGLLTFTDCNTKPPSFCGADTCCPNGSCQSSCFP